MKKEYSILLFVSLAILSLLSFVPARVCENGECYPAKCGDSVCDAGQYEKGGMIEDISTCYNDCAYTDYINCTIDSINGGTCTFKGVDYKVSNVKQIGCGDGESINLTISFGQFKREFPGIAPEFYIQLADDVFFLFPYLPCAAFQTKYNIFFKGIKNQNEWNNFVNLSKKNINLKKDKQISVQYSFPQSISNPYCVNEIKSENGELLTSLSSLGCSPNPWIISLDNVKSGIYTLSSEIFDNTAKNSIASKQITVTINECQTNEECSDGNFLTKDSCSGENFEVCSNKLNYTLIVGGSIIILFVVILVILIARRKPKQEV